jgi:hypothetical protein
VDADTDGDGDGDAGGDADADADTADGIIPNSTDLIWEDSFGPNIGDPSACNSGWGQFRAEPQTFPINGSFPKVIAWNELLSEGTGASCSPEISTSTNTLVQWGVFAYWVYYEVGGWQQVFKSNNHSGLSGDGYRFPHIGDPLMPYTNFRGCTEYSSIRAAHTDWEVYRGARDNLGTYKPEYYWDFHGWTNIQHTLDYARRPKALLATMYARLIVDNPALPDDRANAKFLMHIGADQKNAAGQTVVGDIGMSRWKRITNDWQPFSFLTGGWTKEQFMATNPPILSTPF